MSTAPDFSQLVLDIPGGELGAFELLSIMLEDNSVYIIMDAMCLHTSLENGYALWYFMTLSVQGSTVAICWYPLCRSVPQSKVMARAL